MGVGAATGDSPNRKPAFPRFSAPPRQSPTFPMRRFRCFVFVRTGLLAVPSAPSLLSFRS